MLWKKTLTILVTVGMVAGLAAGCGGGGGDEAATPAGPVLGVIVGHAEGEEGGTVTMLVDGVPVDYPVTKEMYEGLVTNWEEYSHWGLYQAQFNADGAVSSLEYGDGVVDIIGIYADKYAKKELPDVLAFADDTVTFVNVDNLLDSDDPEDLPGFSTEVNESLTPANGESFVLSPEAMVYVEGADGLFMRGDTGYITGAGYDYVEFYDIEGDGVYDIVIVWLV